MRILVFFGVLVFIFSCSTEKNTLLNRTYHGTTAHYNGYFNANDLLTQSLASYKLARKEDYYTILPLNPLPSEEDVKGMYPAIDTAIAKCAKVISKHSMPTVAEPSKKNAEHNEWIDENWLTIGIANYYRRDYELAQKNFKYINKFFSNDPSNYIAAIWMAKTNIETNKLSEASIILTDLDKQIEEMENVSKPEKSKSKTKSKSKKRKKKSKSKSEDEEKAKFPKKSRFLFEITKADLAIKQADYKKAITNLEKSLEFSKKSADKARVHFILGQLNSLNGDREKAKYHYGKVLRYNAPFEMNFNARINRALMGGSQKIKQELQKMLKDDKNVDFKDQIYFALAEIAIQEGQKPKGIEYMHNAILFSTKNNRQKAICYERLGDFSFTDRSYVVAQKYYDSCAKVLPENYPNADVIRNKATKLKDLVTAVETAQYEDSVQRIAKMSEPERLAFAENVIAKMKADEKRRKEEELKRLKAIQEQQAKDNESKSTTKFFWNNAKMKSEGLESFRKQWGARENEDDWRRSEKTVIAVFTEIENDSLQVQDSLPIAAKDSITPESLLANLPLTDSLVSLSNQRLLGALFDAGVIYKDQLKEEQFAKKQFESVLDRKLESKYNLLSLFQLYKMYEVSDPPKAYTYKNEILVSYPESDYAYFLSDPDFFIKKKEFEQLSENDYIKVLDRYNRGLYPIVISSANQVVDNEPENPYRSKYMLLRAMSVGQTNTNKEKMLPYLKEVIREYPGTNEEKKAKEIIEIMEKGYSAFVESNFENKSIYSFDENADYSILVFLGEKDNSALSKSKVSDFSKEFFGRERLNVSSKVFGTNQSVILASQMNLEKAQDYVRTFKKTKKHLGDLNSAKIVAISTENLRLLFETQKLEDYELFYLEFY